MLTSSNLITTAIMTKLSQYSTALKRLHVLLQDEDDKTELDSCFSDYVIHCQVPPVLVESCMDWVASINELEADRLRMLAVANIVISNLSKMNLLEDVFVNEGALFSRNIAKLDFSKFDYVFTDINDDNWDTRNITPQELSVLYEFAPNLASCYNVLIDHVRRDDALRSH